MCTKQMVWVGYFRSLNRFRNRVTIFSVVLETKDDIPVHFMRFYQDALPDTVIRIVCYNSTNNSMLVRRCGLHADFTELTACVGGELDRHEGSAVHRRYFYITLLREPVSRWELFLCSNKTFVSKSLKQD